MTKDNRKDLSSSLLWTLKAPIDEITDLNAEAVIDWLKDRSSVLVCFLGALVMAALGNSGL